MASGPGLPPAVAGVGWPSTIGLGLPPALVGVGWPTMTGPMPIVTGGHPSSFPSFLFSFFLSSFLFLSLFFLSHAFFLLPLLLHHCGGMADWGRPAEPHRMPPRHRWEPQLGARARHADWHAAEPEPTHGSRFGSYVKEDCLAPTIHFSGHSSATVAIWGGAQGGRASARPWHDSAMARLRCSRASTPLLSLPHTHSLSLSHQRCRGIPAGGEVDTVAETERRLGDKGARK